MTIRKIIKLFRRTLSSEIDQKTIDDIKILIDDKTIPYMTQIYFLVFLTTFNNEDYGLYYGHATVATHKKRYIYLRELAYEDEKLAISILLERTKISTKQIYKIYKEKKQSNTSVLSNTMRIMHERENQKRQNDIGVKKIPLIDAEKRTEAFIYTLYQWNKLITRVVEEKQFESASKSTKKKLIEELDNLAKNIKRLKENKE